MLLRSADFQFVPVKTSTLFHNINSLLALSFLNLYGCYLTSLWKFKPITSFIRFFFLLALSVLPAPVIRLSEIHTCHFKEAAVEQQSHKKIDIQVVSLILPFREVTPAWREQNTFTGFLKKLQSQSFRCPSREMLPVIPTWYHGSLL